MIKAAVVGATGYAGIELTRILSGHPEIQIQTLVSKSFAGQNLKDIYPNYASIGNYVLEDLDVSKIQSTCDIAFLALPHGQSIEVAPQLIQSGLKVIDLSGDFRYDNPEVYEQWYHIHHTQVELLQKAVYGLCELYEPQIAKASMVANPGCYTTCSILPVYPLLKDRLVKGENIIIDAKSGTTGAGRSEKLGFSFCEVNESFKAYGVSTHRHTSEIEQELSKANGAPLQLIFTPHLLPVQRGILATIYLDIMPGVDAAQVAQCYEKAYGAKPFTHVLPHGKLPELKFVVGSNNCFIGYQLDARMNKLIVVSCIDNLVKGAAGQAVQNCNLMFGMDQAMGLDNLGWYL